MSRGKKIDLSRPDIAFALVWGLTWLLNSIFPLSIAIDDNDQITLLIICNILSFIILYKFCKYFVVRNTKVLNSLNINEFNRLLKKLFYFFCFMYFITVYYSKGLPLYWLLAGDYTRSYVDFGVPSLQGFLYMIRAFVLSGFMYIYMVSKNSRSLIIPVVLIGLSIAEVARGNIIVLVIQGASIVFLLRKYNASIILKLALSVIVLILSFGIFGDYRNNGSGADPFISDDGLLSELPSGFKWVLVYVTSPLNNLNNFSYTDSNILPFGINTLNIMLPTFIKEALLGQKIGQPLELVNEALNATTFYSPLLADFGVVATFFIVALIQLIVSIIHIKAQQGQPKYIMMYPPLYMSILLSFFYLYFFSMITIVYLICTFLVFKFFRLTNE